MHCMCVVLIHLFLFKHPRFILNLADFLKQRTKSKEMAISITLVGCLYVTGGLRSSQVFNPWPVRQVDVVDLSSGERSRGPPMCHPRVVHAAAASTTSLFVFGGDATGKSVEVFNPQARQ